MTKELHKSFIRFNEERKKKGLEPVSRREFMRNITMATVGLSLPFVNSCSAGTEDSDTGTEDSDTGTKDSDTGTKDSDTGTKDSDTGTEVSDTGSGDSITGGGATAGTKGSTEKTFPPLPRTGIVTEVFEDAVCEGPQPGVWHPEYLPEMVDRSVKALCDTDDVNAAWLGIMDGYQPGHKVAIKVNLLAVTTSSIYGCHTRWQYVKCITDALQSHLDVPAGDIIIYDGEYNSKNPFEEGTGYDDTNFPGINILLKHEWGFDDSVMYTTAGGARVRLSKIVTQSEHLINIAVIKTHRVTGMTGCLKNHLGSINMPNLFNHNSGPDGGYPDVGRYCDDPHIRNKTRLCILDAMQGLKNPNLGPEGEADFWPKKMLMSLDPVAIDQHGKNILSDEVEITEKNIAEAEAVGLGSRTYTTVHG